MILWIASSLTFTVYNGNAARDREAVALKTAQEAAEAAEAEARKAAEEKASRVAEMARRLEEHVVFSSLWASGAMTAPPLDRDVDGIFRTVFLDRRSDEAVAAALQGKEIDFDDVLKPVGMSLYVRTDVAAAGSPPPSPEVTEGHVGRESRQETANISDASIPATDGIAAHVDETLGSQNGGQMRRGSFAYVRSLVAGGLAESAGWGHAKLQAGDQLVEINGMSLESVEPEEVFKLFDAPKISLVVAKSEFYVAYLATRNSKGRQLDRFGVKVKEVSNAVMGSVADLKEASLKLAETAKSKVSSWLKWGSKRTQSWLTPRSTNTAAGLAAPALGGKALTAGDMGLTERPDMFESYVPMPVVRGSSEILSAKAWCSLWTDMPDRMQFKEAQLIFSTAIDGCSLKHLYSKSVSLYFP